MENYTQKFGTLTDRAYATAKTFAFTYDFTKDIKNARANHINEPGLRYGFILDEMLTALEELLEGYLHIDDLWVEPDEEAFDIYPEIFREYATHDIFLTFHPEVIKIIAERFEDEEYWAACGHYYFLYELDEAPNQRLYGYNASC